MISSWPRRSAYSSARLRIRFIEARPRFYAPQWAAWAAGRSRHARSLGTPQLDDFIDRYILKAVRDEARRAATLRYLNVEVTYRYAPIRRAIFPPRGYIRELRADTHVKRTVAIWGLNATLCTYSYRLRWKLLYARRRHYYEEIF